MSVDSVWEPILDIFSHLIFIWCTEPVFHSDCSVWKYIPFSCDIFFFPSDRYCLFASRWCCSFSVWPVFTACSHLKVTDSQLHKVIRHATAKARLKQQNAGRAFMACSPPSLAKQVGRCRGSIAPHSLYIQQHPLSMRCYSPSLGGVRSLLVDPAASTVS